MAELSAAAVEVLNSSAPLVRPASKQSAASSKVPSSARSSRKSASSSRKRGSARGSARKASSGGKPSDEEFLVSARAVDNMIYAIHQDGTKDYTANLEIAYNRMSRGMKLPEGEASLAKKLAEMGPTSARSDGKKCHGPNEPDRTPAVGPVPGMEISPPKGASRPRFNKKGEKEDSVQTVAAPWGPERDNLDKPPWHHTIERRQHYCKMLDQQNADKSEHRRVKAEKEHNIDRLTNTSFETGHHRWGTEPSDPNKEKAIFHELLATVDYRVQRDRQEKAVERKEALRMGEEVEKQMAWQWHVRREEDKQEKDRLASLWTAAAKDRKNVEEAHKASALREEQDVVKLMSQGQVPARRLRRPKEECILVQEAMPPPHRPQALTPIFRASGGFQ